MKSILPLQLIHGSFVTVCITNYEYLQCNKELVIINYLLIDYSSKIIKKPSTYKTYAFESKWPLPAFISKSVSGEMFRKCSAISLVIGFPQRDYCQLVGVSIGLDGALWLFIEIYWIKLANKV